MKKLKLVIKEKGKYIQIPGIAPFRTPASVRINKTNLPIVLQVLHKCSVNDFEIVSDDNPEVTVETQPIKHKKDSEINDRLDKLESLLTTLVSKNLGQKSNNSEQITNRLGRIERMLNSGGKVVHEDMGIGKPRIEEMEDQYIPEIDLSDMKLSGKSIEVVDKKSNKDVDDAVDLLSSLTRNGGK
jgi:hypothetical protein